MVATMDGVADYVCREWVDEIFLAPPQYAPYPADFVDRLILTGVTVHQNLVVGGSRRGRKQIIEKVGNYLVLTTSMNFSTTVQAFLKRSMDIVGGLVGCLLTGIIFVFVAPMIYHASPGLEETASALRCTSSAACIWTRRSERKIFWIRIRSRTA